MKLHDYQEVARDHLRAHRRSALFLDMGLGKTASTLAALTADHLPALVIAPKRVAETVWPEEAKLWRPDLRARVASGVPASRKAALRSGEDILVLGRDNIQDALALPAGTWRTLVLDELSGFKNRGSIRWKAANRLSAVVDHVWGLTGTPAPNGLLDLWAPMYLLDRGQRLERSLTAYRSRYFVPGNTLASGVVTDWRMRPEAEANIHHLISDICLSMTTEGRIQLPPVTYNTVHVELPPAVMRAYRSMKQTLVSDLRTVGGEIHTAMNAAVLTNKLSQMAAGFLYVDDAAYRDSAYTPLHREKIKAVEEIVEGTGSPVLVFYRYKVEERMLMEALPQARTIDEPGVIEAWKQGRVPLLLAHPASAGHGLNLQTGGNTIVWTTRPWSLEEWQQANKRLIRQGQKHPVIIHSIEAHRTVDAAIRSRLDDKATVQDALMDHLESPL